MVQECCTYVDKTPDKETKIKLIETLRTITEGKIYVEVERARLTHILAKMREDENNVAEAAKIIQELQVETYGSMDKREKVELILEQMRLCLAIKDYVRTQIISKKINTKFFEDENTKVGSLTNLVLLESVLEITLNKNSVHNVIIIFKLMNLLVHHHLVKTVCQKFCVSIICEHNHTSIILWRQLLRPT